MSCPGCSNLHWLPEHYSLDHHPDCPAFKTQAQRPFSDVFTSFIQTCTSMDLGIITRCGSCKEPYLVKTNLNAAVYSRTPIQVICPVCQNPNLYLNLMAFRVQIP